MHFSLHNGIRIPYGGQAGILQTHWHKESGHFPVLPGKWLQKLKLLKALPLRLTFVLKLWELLICPLCFFQSWDKISK